jgi:uncharacterized protein (DUF488 family)
MKLYTIGFSGKSAESFFEKLTKNNVKCLIDTRRHNQSQLAGFTKQNDLKFFLKKIAGIEYLHILDYAPTADMLKDYRAKKIDWVEYEIKYSKLIQNKLEGKIKWGELDSACLLCSEASPDHCHRRLLADYFKSLRSDIEICHL